MTEKPREAELKAQTAAMLEKARAAFDGVESIVEFYLKREIEAPANHQEFAREAQEKLDAFRQAQRALIPTDYAAALADREAEIHHGYQCGETYARLVSAQVDSIVAEKVRKAVREKESLITKLEKELKSWQSEFNMWRSAWLREIGGVIRNKHHEIDGFVLRTRDIYEKAQRFDKMDKDLIGRAAAASFETQGKPGGVR